MRGQIIAGLVGIVALLGPAANAGTLALDIFENAANTGSAGTQSLGWQFQVNVPILVDGLGFFDHTDTQSHDVGIYLDSNQSLLVSGTVVTSDPQAGTGPWRVHTITPFLLNPGTYDIAAETGSDNYTSAPTSMTTAPEITFNHDAFLFGSATLAFPSASSGGGLQAWFGPTFTFTDVTSTVPEPSYSILLGGGLLAIASLACRRRRYAK